MDSGNPFSLVRASDYTDDQINRFWVEVGDDMINSVIEPRARISKFILGGKGTGKTHLLRYYSYPVIRLRRPNCSGISIAKDQKFLAVFMRATGVDAARFEHTADRKSIAKWQQLFGIYLELRLAEGALDALCDIKVTSPKTEFDDEAFLSEIAKTVVDKKLESMTTVSDFRKWVIDLRRSIDDAVNNAAFTGNLDLRVPLSIGALSLPMKRAISKWNPDLSELPLIYLLDEIENFTESQQQVVNTLIRYGESNASFRVTGRLYAVKTQSTLASGEMNREGSEFKVTLLDDILMKFNRYPEFAKKFIIKRLQSSNLIPEELSQHAPKIQYDPELFFEEIDTSEWFTKATEQLHLDLTNSKFINKFERELKQLDESRSAEISQILTRGFTPIIQKLNILIFCKKHNKQRPADLSLANSIANQAQSFIEERPEEYYKNAYSHYCYDLFAQLCRESRSNIGVPYAGFKSFVKMSSGNPRSLLIILGHIFSNATFKNIQFVGNRSVPLQVQTEGAIEAARFMFEADSNFGGSSDLARKAADRLATLLRTARYSLNIPEVSPLTVSFSDSDLSPQARETLNSALNYSFVFEGGLNRPDRNSHRINRKIQLNPLLSPRWQLPISRRGDISLNANLLNAIFDPFKSKDFDYLLSFSNDKWNHPFKPHPLKPEQQELF